MVKSKSIEKTRRKELKYIVLYESIQIEDKEESKLYFDKQKPMQCERNVKERK